MEIKINTPQQLVDAFAAHMRKQGEPALSEDGDSNCVYRTESGLKCGIGGLLTDEAYRRNEVEGEQADSAIVRKALRESGIETDSVDDIFMRKLQYIHDDAAKAFKQENTEQFFMSRFEQRLKEFCADENMVYPAQVEPAPYVPTYIYAPCRIDDDTETTIECDRDEAEFFAVYERLEDGTSDLFEDYPLECEAKAVAEALTEISKGKTGEPLMKLVDTDNFGGDYPNEKFLEGFDGTAEQAKVVADKLNKIMGHGHPNTTPSRFWKVVPHDYVLQPGFEP